MDIQFRPARPDEYPAIVEMMRMLNSEDPGEEQHQGANAKEVFRLLDLHPDLGTIYIATASDDKIGYALMVTHLSNEFGGLAVYLDEFYLLREYRNAGVGSRFLRFLVHEYRSRKYACMLLEVMDGNDGAARFYERNGFARLARGTMTKALR